MSDSEIFWKHVTPKGDDDCWEWNGFRKPTGYGQNPAMSEQRAHRMSWVLNRGPIPDGMCVLHECDNPPCVNPGHLFLGTMRENNMDRDSKGRQRSLTGDASPLSKLTSKQVLEIRALFDSGMTKIAIARRFGIGKTQVRRIVNRVAWRNLK